MHNHSHVSWHGLRNLLSGVTGVLETVKHRSFEPDQLAEFLSPEKIDLMLHQLYLTHDLISSELRLDKVKQDDISDLTYLTEQVHTLLQHHKKSVGIDFELINHLEPSIAVPLKHYAMQDIMLNLVVNAFEACSEGSSPYRVEWSLYNDAQWVWMRVKNTGHPLSDDLKTRIFERGFTTKATGEGIGLSDTLYSIEQAGGHLQLSSESPFVAIFTVKLPRIHHE